MMQRNQVVLYITGSVLVLVCPLVTARAGTTITVDSLADSFVLDGRITLREALVAANTDAAAADAPAGAGRDTIVFHPALFAAGPQTLNMAGTEYPVTRSVDIPQYTILWEYAAIELNGCRLYIWQQPGG